MRQRLLILSCLGVVGLSAPSVYVYAAEQKEVTQSSNIKEFINYVLEVNPAIAEAQARVMSAKAGKRAASKWRYNPEIEYGVEDVDGEKKTRTYGISQTIDWNGKFISSGKTAGFELQAVEADRDDVRLNVMVNVLSGLAEYRATKAIYELAVKRTEFMERFAKLAKKGFKAGDIDRSEYNLAELALSEALIAQADAQSALEQSKQALSSSIGFSLAGGDISMPDLPNDLPELPEAQDTDQLLLNLPSIRAMRSREEAAKAAITSAKKDRIADPTIGLMGGKDTGSNVVGFSVSVPINVFNSYGAEVDQAKQDAIAQAKAGQNAYFSAKSRLEAAHSSYILSYKAWKNWQRNGAQALAEQTDVLDRKFKVGDLSATDYLVQIKQALDTQVAAEELHSKVWQSWFAWLGASGIINQWIQNSGE